MIERFDAIRMRPRTEVNRARRTVKAGAGHGVEVASTGWWATTDGVAAERETIEGQMTTGLMCSRTGRTNLRLVPIAWRVQFASGNRA